MELPWTTYSVRKGLTLINKMLQGDTAWVTRQGILDCLIDQGSHAPKEKTEKKDKKDRVLSLLPIKPGV
jgi:hypothetical protein